ncbi:MAG: TetR/AcrR family transcriptional regulator [Dehalococcoidales bacterium]|jgi:AcrR family transcriptional regulator|nr:TetR/AcrR family transcriptional regulator [Dehalococcoidales bacterium]
MQKRKETAVRQKEIISAARKLIVKYGSEHVTVKRMANEIGVSEAAIYRHFKSKNEILSFLIEDVEKTLIEDIETNYSGELNSLEILEKIILSHISAIEQRKGVTFQVIAEIISLGDKKLNKKVYDAITRYISRIREILVEGIKTGVIKPDIEPEAAARLFFGITQGLVNLWALSQYTFDLEQEYRAMWNIFLQAIAVKPAGQTSLPVQQ